MRRVPPTVLPSRPGGGAVVLEALTQHPPVPGARLVVAELVLVIGATALAGAALGLSAAAALAAVLPCALAPRRGEGRTLLGVFRPRAVLAAAAGGAVAVLGVALLPASSVLGTALSVEARPDVAAWLQGRAMLCAVASAWIEELYFRGYVQERLAAVCRPRPGRDVLSKPVVIGALLFAAAHIPAHGIGQAALRFFPGWLFGWTRTRSGGVAAPFVLHALFNVAALAAGGGSCP